MWHILALALGFPVGELKRRMSRAEFLRWGRFYIRYPFDDLHRYHRPAAMVACSLGGGEPQGRLEWLFPDQGADGMTDADAATLRAFGYSRKG
jgi:hypothetical protein